MTERPAYAELHCHTNFSFLDGASPPDELVERAVELGLAGLAVTDRNGLYGVVRFAAAAREAGIRPVIGIEVELADAAAHDPAGIVIPPRRAWRPGRRRDSPPIDAWDPAADSEGLPARPRPGRALLPGHRAAVKEDLRGIGEAQRGPGLVLLARNAAGYRSLCRLVSRANMAGTKSMPRFTHELLAENTEGLVALCGGRESEIGRRLRAGDREGARKAAERYAALFGGGGATGLAGVTAGGHGRHHSPGHSGDSAATAGFFLELQHHLLPDDDWLAAETARLAGELGLPVVVTNDVRYAYPEGRELHDVLTAIRHGRALDELRDLRRPDGESYLKSAAELMALPPAGGPAARSGAGWQGVPQEGSVPAAWVEGIGNSAELAAGCSVDLGFERYRFPGFPIPKGHTPFSYLEGLCHEGARRRYHPISSPVLQQLAHELDVIERTGLAEFFLICWDIMRFAKGRGIPAQGRGSAADSIVAYVLGITRVDPIRHHLLFERFINEGRTTYPDVDIDFSSERREEVIQYVYERYGPEHTGMVCNLVTYRARSAVREVGYALGFPRPLVDRVAKALETYDSVMVRRDLEADGGFGQFFAETVEREAAAGAVMVGSGAAGASGGAAGSGAAMAVGPARSSSDVRALAASRGLTDAMGQLNHPRGGRIVASGAASAAPAADQAVAAAGQSAPVGVGAPALAPASVAPFPLDSALSGTNHCSAVAATDEESVEAPGASDPRSLRPDPRSVAQDREPLPVANSALRRSGRSYAETNPRNGRATTWATPGDAVTAGATATPDATPLRVADLGGGSALEQERRLARRMPVGSDTEGGPGDSPASIARLAAERASASGRAALPATSEARATLSGREPATRHGPGGPEPLAERSGREAGARGATVAGLPATAATATAGQPATAATATAGQPATAELRRGSTAGMPDWERWLAFCARIDGFPRHLSIHSGGMLVTAAPLIDIAPLERATMPGRVVVQFDKRDVETLKLIKLDLLGLGMLSAIDETLQLIEHDAAVCVDLDRLPEDVPEVFEMMRAADTVGVFQVESRAQMQTLPKSRPSNLDDLVVEVAIIRPGPIQGNAVHPYLRRRQGLEPVTYLHPSLEPVLRETLGVILYQEQVMQVAITVAGFSAAESDGFRRAMGTWRSSREMEKLHERFVTGCKVNNGLTDEQAEELFRRVAAFASFGFAKSHAAAFARTAYESSFLKLFYPAQFTAGLINAQPMGFYPVEVLVNDAKRHGVAVLPADVNASTYKTATEWVGREGEPLPPGCGIERRPVAVRSSGCIVPSRESRERWTAEQASGYGIRLGLALVKGIGEEHAERLDAELAREPYTTLADVVARTDLPEETIERLIRSGALDSLGRPRRELLWQLREVMGATRGRSPGSGTAAGSGTAGGAGPAAGGGVARWGAPSAGSGVAARGGSGRATSRGRSASYTGPAAGRPMDLRLPPTPAPDLPPLTERERLGDSYAVLSLDARHQVIELFRPALEQLGAVTNASLSDRSPGPVRLGGLVVTRQHPMTARGTVFLALEDETGMVNVTLWPDAWARLRGVVRRHALLFVDGTLQRESNVVNVVARTIEPLAAAAERVGGPPRPEGVRSLGYGGMRRGR